MNARPLLLMLLAVTVVPVAAAAPAPCAAAAYRQLDFWVGDWDVFDVDADAAPAARVHVTRVLDGCVIHELYEATASDGLRGESFSIFDRSRGLWHQTWVTNRGRLLQIEGAQQDGRLVLQGDYVAEDGRHTSLRGEWWQEKGTVRERAETSTDGGRTWQPAFDLVFRAHRG
jgi:hypothetical protein